MDTAVREVDVNARAVGEPPRVPQVCLDFLGRRPASDRKPPEGYPHPPECLFARTQSASLLDQTLRAQIDFHLKALALLEHRLKSLYGESHPATYAATGSSTEVVK